MTWTELAPFASIAALLLNLGALAVAYGKMTQKVESLGEKVTDNEEHIEKALVEIRAFEMEATRKFATSESIARLEDKMDKVAERIDRVLELRRP